MHRTEAAGNVANAYVDRNLPTVAGTKLEASDRNAIQEEIANVIERAGLTLKTKATETGDQLIESFTNPVTKFISLTALQEGNANLIAGDRSLLFRCYLDGVTPRVSIGMSDVSDTMSFQLQHSGLQFDEYATGRKTIISAAGVTYWPVGTQQTIGSIKTAVYDASSLTWSVYGGTTGLYNTGDDLALTGIPWNATPIQNGVFLRFKRSGDNLPSICPVNAVFKDGSGTLTLDGALITSLSDPDAGTNQQLIISYEVT